MPKELEGIIESNGETITFEGNLGTFIYPDELAQAIIDAGYVKREEMLKRVMEWQSVSEGCNCEKAFEEPYQSPKTFNR